MAMVDFVSDYEDKEWDGEELENYEYSNRAINMGLRKIGATPIFEIEIPQNDFRSFKAIKRIQRYDYVPSQEKQLLSNKENNIIFNDLLFSSLPTISFSFSLLGIIAFLFAYSEKQPAYLIPSVVAIVGFTVLGSVSCYISRAMKKV